MGLLGSLLGGEEESTQDSSDDHESITIQNYYFLNEYPPPDSYLDYSLIIGPHPDQDTWGVMRCNVELTVPSNTNPKIVVVRDGNIVGAPDGFQAHEGWITSEEDLEEMDIDDAMVMDFPEDLQDVRIPEGGEWSDEQLRELTVSFADP